MGAIGQYLKVNREAFLESMLHGINGARCTSPFMSCPRDPILRHIPECLSNMSKCVMRSRAKKGRVIERWNLNLMNDSPSQPW